MMIHVTALWRAGARRSRRIASVLSCWILSGLFVSAGFAQGGVPRWDDRFQGYGVDGAIYAMAMDAAGHVYVAGSFNRAGGLPAKNVAMWDGTRWSALGKGVGQSSADAVNALFFGNDGRLYAGGSFEAATQSDGVVIEANNLAVWDGVRWESLGSGVNDEVFALAGAANGSVYIGGIFSQDGQGEFDLGKVAVWDGNDLSPVGDGLGTFSSVSVQAFAFDSAGDLYAAGASLAGGIFKWDGATWAAIGAPHNGAVYAMAIDSQDRIYVGGTMTQVTQPDASLASVGRIARWESTGWDLLAGGLNTDVRALVIDDQDRVYAGGLFTRTPGGGMTLNHVALWNDAWSPLGTGAGDDPFDEVSTLLLASDGALLVGGDVYYIDGKIANGFGIWRNGGWDTAGGEGLDSEVHALAYDAAGGLYAGGAFLYAGAVASRGVAHWDGDTWSAVGGGVDGVVRAVAVGGDGTVYVGGEFTSVIQPGGAALEAFNIAAWNGSAWSALGEGLDDTVYALAIDADGGLVAGGAFGYNGPGQMVLNYVARWDGAAWNGMSVGMDADVLALAVASDGTLYAGGAFTAADGAANAAHLARWTGSAWEGLSADALIDNTVRTLAVDDAGMLYAGGDFTSVTNNLVAGYVVGWDGAQWVFLGGAQSNGVTGCCVTSLAVASDGAVIVGGSFEGANRPVGPPVAVAGLASYAGGAWEALASGIDGSPAAMAVNGADLYVGGAFRVAGGFASSHLGRWSVNVSYVSTEDGEPALPETHALSAVYPNPFNPTAHFSLNIRETQDVRVDVYDMLGRRIAQLYQGVMTGGVTHEFALEAGAWRSGTYLIRVTGAGFTDTRSVVLLK